MLLNTFTVIIYFFIISLFKANIFKIQVKLNKCFYIIDLSPYKYYLKMEVIRD